MGVIGGVFSPARLVTMIIYAVAGLPSLPTGLLSMLVEWNDVTFQFLREKISTLSSLFVRHPTLYFS